MSEWISVEDRRPKTGEIAIWYHPEKKDSGGRTHLKEYYRIDLGDLQFRPATHWMPLPEPPE